MKLRIKDNTLRLRVSRSDVTRLLAAGRIDATIHFASAPDSKLTYGLEHRANAALSTLEYKPTEVVIVIPSTQAHAWANSDQVGIYGVYSLGQGEQLELIVEKDFACLDLSDADNEDTYPNPGLGVECRT